jgi:hypothetical protein
MGQYASESRAGQERRSFKSRKRIKGNDWRRKTTLEAPTSLYVTRSGCVLRPPSCLIKTAYAVNLCEGNDTVKNEIIECVYSIRKAMLVQKAMVSRPEGAKNEEAKKSTKRRGDQGNKN